MKKSRRSLKLTLLAVGTTLAAAAPIAARADQTISGASPGITNTGTNNITVTATGAIGGSYTGIDNLGAISALNNSGTVSGSTYGINNGSNAYTITLLNNSGTIMGSGGSFIGIYNNGGTINALNNSGTINRYSYGIYNFAGTIGTLNNTGTISGSGSGAAGVDIYNSGGTINALNNSGTINGNSFGIYNTSGIIGTLTNTGTISAGIDAGTGTGIYNSQSTINALNNSGAINGNSFGIYNTSGTIGTLTNSGVISAGNYAILNAGTIGTLDNSGSISGGTYGIYSSGTIGAFSNSGLISGSVYAFTNRATGTIGPIANTGRIEGDISNLSNQNLTINGGTGTSFGSLSGFGGGIGTISNTLSDVVFGSGNQLLNDNIVVGTHTVNNVAGTLQVNNRIGITGNYSQGAGATLLLGITDGAVANGVSADTAYGRLRVSGGATIAAGATVALKSLNNYAFAQGQRFIAVRAASGGTNYNAGSLTYTAAGYGGTVVGTSVVDGSNTDLLLTLANGGRSVPINMTSDPDSNASESALFNYGGLDDSLLNLFDAAAALDSAAASNRAGAQLNPASVIGAAVHSSTASTDQILRMAGSHINAQHSARGQGGSGIASGESGADHTMWGQVFGGQVYQGARGDISGYRAGYNGLLIGADTQIGDDWRVGGLVSYANTSATGSDNHVGSSARTNSYGLLGYAGYEAQRWYLNLLGGAVQHKYSTLRDIDFPGFAGDPYAQFNGMQYVTSIQGGVPIRLDSSLHEATLTPVAGMTYSVIRHNGYTESAGNGAALTVGAASSTSIKSNLGVNLKCLFDTVYGALVPSLDLAWNHQFRRDGMASVASFAADASGASAFVTQDAPPMADTGTVSLSMALMRSETLSLTARYTIEAASGYAAQSADLRLRYRF